MKNTIAEILKCNFGNLKPRKKSLLLLCALLFISAIYFPDAIFAQQLNPTEIAPPPLKILSKDEQKQLDEETDLKKRTSLALEMMDTRIEQAEKFDAQNDFPKMYNELGRFHAIMDYVMKFLGSDNRRNKTLNSYKAYEMGLGKFPSRIELMRRELPVQYESYLRDLLKDIREMRGKAIEPFFSDTVVPNN